MILNEICTVKSNNFLTANICSLELETDKMASTTLIGQFIHIKCDEGTLLRRPISVCDVYDNIIRIVFEVKGKGTDFLSKCKVGDSLDVLGSIGKGFDLEKSGDSPVFIGGGIGVPPLLYSCKMAKALGKKVTAILGFRNADAVILKDEFEAVCDKVYITTDDGSFGVHGFVSDVLKDNIDSVTAVHSCGPHGMLKAITNIALPKDIYCEVSMEERMGCGVGACLVCACKAKSNDRDFDLKHVCKDGPVFDARTVIL